MAIMGRRKKAVAQSWGVINKKRAEQTKKEQQEFKEKQKKGVSEEEHQKRMKILKNMGIIKKKDSNN